MRLLLTGSNGFVGRAAAAHLLAQGHFVVGLGRSPTPATAVSDYVRHDLSRPFEWAGEADAVVHAAALAVPWARPAAFVAANADGTRHVVEWCRSHGRPRLVYLSSSSVFYRREDQFDLTEDSPIPSDREQINAYSRTKRAGERAVEGYEGSWLILRPRAVYGAGDTVLLPRILAAAEAGRLPILRRPDGKRTFGDLLAIDNLVEYVRRALEHPVEGALNLTDGEPVDIHAFVLDLLARLGCPAPRREVPLALAMTAARLAEWVSAAFLGYREPPVTRFGVSVFAWSKTFDISRARAALGPPAVSRDQAVERFVTWWRATGTPARSADRPDAADA